MRFQIMALPDIVNRRFTDALAGGQEPATPLRHTFGFAAQRGIHNRLDLFRPVGRFAAPPRACRSPNRCVLNQKDFFLFGASSSVWDCGLIRRPAKDARSEDMNRPRPGYKQKRLVITKWLSNLRCHCITMM
jgi:hypothetical protein